MSLDEATINDLKKLKEDLEANLIHQQQMQNPNTNPNNTQEKGE